MGIFSDMFKLKTLNIDADIHAHRGSYKTTSNHVGAFNEHGEQVAVIFETATPFDTPRLMTELADWYSRVRPGVCR
jgi:hypothetical protein